MSNALAERSQELNLAEADLAKLKAYGQVRHVAKGEALWSEGANPDTLWHVESGKVNMVITSADGMSVVRDAFACKPAVVAETEHYVAVASEYRALAHLPGIGAARVFEPQPEEVYTWNR